MIETRFFFNFLKKNNIDFFCGVPDSILKASDDYLGNLKPNQHIITQNEGGAVATAIGYYLKTKKLAGVYLQNSGLGNAINPIVSVADTKVYSIPMLLIIGWRGAPNDQKDEPQHQLQGKITTKLLKLLNIKYCYLDDNKDFRKLKNLINKSKKKRKIVACLVRKKKLTNQKKIKTKIIKKTSNNSNIKRIDVLNFISKKDKNLKIFSTTGYTSRELHQIRILNKNKNFDFYNVGGMGHTSSIALGYSIKSKNKNILCIDGDGSILMHMGAMTINGNFANKNFKHIVLNNYQHESVGGQKTSSKHINFKLISKGCGYKKFYLSKNFSDFKKKYINFINSPGPSFFEIITLPGTIKNLSRPKNLKELIKKF